MKQPNIVFILSDDQDAWAMGCAGNNELITPNLDNLAAGGIRFDNFFCTSPVCSPARASILTGRISSQHGVHDWIRKGNIENPNDTYQGQDRPIEYLQGLTGYTDYLTMGGYTCALSGKWHLGDSGAPQKGFSYWYTHAFGGSSYFSYPMFRDGKMKDKTRYVTDEITDGALQFLDGYAGEKKPFYLSIHSTAPHSPWDAPNHPTEYLDMYSSCAFQSTPDVPRHVNSRSTDDSPEKRRENLTGYFAAITAMDRCVGKLVAKLKALGKYENTLFIFTSDNGMNMGHHGIWGKGNGTFPMNMYDTSVRVPMIVSMPGIVPEGVVEKGMFSQYDIMPQDESLPGKSFAAVIDGKHAPHDSGAIGVFDEYGPVRMIRDNQWKYIHRYPYGPHELYHLSLDSGEENNLLDDERIEDDGKAKAAELRGRLESWFAQYVDPERDGSRQGVTGLGQLDLVMAVKQGREPFEK